MSKVNELLMVDGAGESMSPDPEQEYNNQILSEGNSANKTLHQEFNKRLSETYGLETDDYWKSGEGFWILRLRAVEKIAEFDNIILGDMEQLREMPEGYVAFKGKAWQIFPDGTKGMAIQTTGSACLDDIPLGASVVTVAENRLNNRRILKCAGLYGKHYGEEESLKFIRSEKE